MPVYPPNRTYTKIPQLYVNTVYEEDCQNLPTYRIYDALNFIIRCMYNDQDIGPNYKYLLESKIFKTIFNTLTPYEHNDVSTYLFTVGNTIPDLPAEYNYMKINETGTSPGVKKITDDTNYDPTNAPNMINLNVLLYNINSIIAS